MDTIPKNHSGEYAFEVEELIPKVQCVNEHIIINQCVYLLIYSVHLIKRCYDQKSFILVIFATFIGKSVNFLYQYYMILLSICCNMVPKYKSISRSITSSILIHS